MNRLLIILLSVLSMSAGGQAQTRYKGLVETGASTIFGQYEGGTIHFSTSHGVRHGHCFYGIGIGYDTYGVHNPFYEEGATSNNYSNQIWDYVPSGTPWVERIIRHSCPIFLDLRRFFCEDSHIVPVIIAKAGVSNYGDRSLTFLYELGIGGRIKTTERTGLSAHLCYRFHDIGYVDDDIIFGDRLNNIGIRVSFDF